MGKDSWFLSSVHKNNEYKTCHKRVSEESDGSGDKNCVQDVHLPLVHIIFTPNHFQGYTAVRNLRSTPNSKTKVSKILKNKEN